MKVRIVRSRSQASRRQPQRVAARKALAHASCECLSATPRVRVP
ncbi:hypothetical protein ACFPRL_29325 [Pseudoclavibacter helvolus]